MNKHIDSDRIPILEKGFFLFLVLCVGMSCKYTQALMYPTNYICTLIALLFSLYLGFKHKIKIRKNFKFVISVICIWLIIQYIKDGRVYPMTLFLFFEIFIAYVVVNTYGTNLFVLYEKYVSKLALVNLCIWFLYLIIPHVIESVLSPFNMVIPNNVLKISLGIVTVSNSSSFLGMRNAGFAQEPGFYSCIIGIALYLNLIMNNFRLKKNQNLYILLLSIISSQSTTGYIILLLLIFFYITNKKARIKFILTPLFMILVPTIIALPFMKEKILEYWYTEESLLSIQLAASNENSTFVPQRIEGIIFELINFFHSPIIGYGIEQDNSYISQRIASNIYLSNGLVKIFAMYGVVLGVLFWTGLIKQFNGIKKRFTLSHGVIFLSLYVIIGTSYDFNFIPLILSIWSFHYFYSYYPEKL